MKTNSILNVAFATFAGICMTACGDEAGTLTASADKCEVNMHDRTAQVVTVVNGNEVAGLRPDGASTKTKVGFDITVKNRDNYPQTMIVDLKHQTCTLGNPHSESYLTYKIVPPVRTPI